MSATNVLSDALDQAGPLRRVLVLGPQSDGIAGQLLRPRREATAASEGMHDAKTPYSAAVAVEDEDPHRAFARVQAVVRPGGPFFFYTTQRGSRGVALLRRYFEVEGGRRTEDGWLWTARVRSIGGTSGHFNEIAPDYATQIPPHLREHYLDQKLKAFARLLPSGWASGLGIDVGAGLGWYANALVERHGARVVAVDPSTVPLALGRAEARTRPWPAFVAGDSLHLPFPDETFDYAYAINMLHHLKLGEQERALREVHRILKPGAPLLVFEINTRNPVFAWYMRHVFPRTRSIDRGDEEFIHPSRWPLVPEFRLETVEYRTFAPDFLPKWSLKAARAIERALERGRLAAYSIHYTALLRKVTSA